MSKSDQSKMNYAARRELRLLRAKTAATVLPWCLGHQNAIHDGDWKAHAAAAAVKLADLLLAELDRTAPKPEETP